MGENAAVIRALDIAYGVGLLCFQLQLEILLKNDIEVQIASGLTDTDIIGFTAEALRTKLSLLMEEDVKKGKISKSEDLALRLMYDVGFLMSSVRSSSYRTKKERRELSDAIKRDFAKAREALDRLEASLDY